VSKIRPQDFLICKLENWFYAALQPCLRQIGIPSSDYHQFFVCIQIKNGGNVTTNIAIGKTAYTGEGWQGILLYRKCLCLQVIIKQIQI